jgi:hypothetical protein
MLLLLNSKGLLAVFRNEEEDAERSKHYLALRSPEQEVNVSDVDNELRLLPLSWRKFPRLKMIWWARLAMVEIFIIQLSNLIRYSFCALLYTIERCRTGCQ